MMVYVWPVQLSARIAFCYLQEFLCWSEDAASVGGPACFLPSPAHTLLSTTSSPYVVVVYSNGSVSLVRGRAVDSGSVSLVGRVTRSSTEKPQ